MWLHRHDGSEACRNQVRHHYAQLWRVLEREEPLVINPAVPSCGCTVPKYPKEPIEPGKGGEIEVTYNGTGKSLGHFKKSITIRTNGAVEISRLYIEGDMKE